MKSFEYLRNFCLSFILTLVFFFQVLFVYLKKRLLLNRVTCFFSISLICFFNYSKTKNRKLNFKFKQVTTHTPNLSLFVIHLLLFIYSFSLTPCKMHFTLTLAYHANRSFSWCECCLLYAYIPVISIL